MGGRVAIIGLACRFPGAAEPGAFWRNLCDGVESITPITDAELADAGVPAGIAADSNYVKASPVLPDIAQFDAAFFEYTPREAALMDPQQRLLLEVAWHAFEDAGHVPGAGAAQGSGVFVGAGGIVTSYLLDRLRHSAEMPGETGSLAHLASDKDFLGTRLSYKLGLTGPSIAVQTACSTSLVAVHLACQSILSGECEMALAGAAVVRVPHRVGYLHVKGGILSPDGRCRAFDAQAAGTVFGSGVGAVLLRDLDAAVAAGDRIYAVIGGTAVNNDGADKISYTASSVAGQARAMVEAMAVAGVSPEEIGFVECHGTGTAVGDPLEIEALTRAFRTGTKRTGFCAVGSVKTNIGHLEQASGVASLIKAALALHHRRIPPSLNFSTPNPKIGFAASPFFVNTECRDWAGSAPRRAAVNSLGLGGTNAFTVLEEAPPSQLPDAALPARDMHILTLSARTREALLAALAAHRAAFDALPESALADACHTLNVARTQHAHRFSIPVGSMAELRSGLAAARLPEEEPRRRLAFLFSGQGSQYAGMGHELYRNEPVFRDTIDRCAARLDARGSLDPPMREVLFGAGGAGRLIDETRWTQPALFVLQVGLAMLWRSWGVVPDVVLGHSVGEFAAAWCAGSLDLEDALDLIAERGALMQELPRSGAMAAVFLDAAAVADAMGQDSAGTLAIAAMNAPEATVVSGDREALGTLLRRFAAHGVRYRELTVSHAFHSPLMQPAMAGLRDAAQAVVARPPGVAFISTVTGDVLRQAPDAAYWVEHALGSVRLVEAARALVAAGATDFLEIGPGTTLLSLGRQCTVGTAGLAWLGSISRGRGEVATLLESVARLHQRGQSIDWPAFHRGRPGRRISLPFYPFETRRFWLESDSDPQRAGVGADAPDVGAPAGRRLRSALPDAQFEAVWGLTPQPWLDDHRIHGMVVLPTAAGLLLLSDAAMRHFGPGLPVEITNLQYRAAMVLPNDGERVAQTVLSPVDGATAEFRFASLHAEKSGDWQTHMVGLARARAGPEPKALDRTAVRARCAPVSVPIFYDALRAMGLGYGPCFRGIQELWVGKGEALTRVVLPPQNGMPGGELHPALLDACLHVYPALAEDGVEDISTALNRRRTAFLPVGVERFSARAGAIAAPLWVHARRRAGRSDTVVVDVGIYAEDGSWIAEIDGLAVRPIVPAVLAADAGHARTADWLYVVRWDACSPLPLPASVPDAPDGRAEWLILADRLGVGSSLADRLHAHGQRCRIVYLDDAASSHPGNPSWRDTPDLAQAFGGLFQAAATEGGHGLRGIVHLWSLDLAPDAGQDGTWEEALRPVLGGALALTQAAAAARRVGPAAPRLWLGTCGAQSALTGDTVGSPLAGALWGFFRSAVLEHPWLPGALVDLDKTASPDQASALLLRELLCGDGEDQVALRGETRLAPRLVRTDLTAPATPFDPDGAYLIAGGLGALGLELARWMVTSRGARHLVLASRRGEDDPAAASARHELESLGADVLVLRADVADTSDVARLVRRVVDAGRPLRGVFHCAGLLDDGVLTQMDWPRMRQVLAPKVGGAWNLDAATRGLPLDHFVLFSSILGLMGSAGQANYAAANAAIDALAARRRHEGLPALVLNWGPWADAGIATASGETGRAIWRARGTDLIPAETGRAALDLLVGETLDQAAITITDWSVFLRQFQSVPPFYRVLADVTGIRRDSARDLDAVAFRSQLRAAVGAERRDLLVGFIRQEAMAAMASTDSIDATRPLRDYGLDSLMSVTLLNRLEAALDVRIDVETLIVGPSVEQLVNHILPGFDGEDCPESSVAAPAVAQSTGGHWLVPVSSRPAARLRLFCFPFAGGGSAVFRAWKDLVDPSIEVIAIEPPGRLARIHEAPIADIARFVEGLMTELPAMLDRPYAVFGHCLGGLTGYETVRHLVRHGLPTPRHIFVSGARPPDRLSDAGQFEERLTRDLLALATFQITAPPHLQPDDVFTEIIRHFEIATSEEMLADTALRDLMLPVVRAEFAMAGTYRFTPTVPWDIPITCFAARGDPYVARRHALGWGRFTNARLQLHIREGKHFAVLDDKAFIAGVISREMLAADQLTP
jgi:acyl transferase domain-containing protein/surfactin synthase thioesterase subunit/acyl carrier protein